MDGKGEKISFAADFLIEQLAGTERPSGVVYREAKKKGISIRTLERAKLLVGVKSRCVYYTEGKAWHMSVPEEMKGQRFSRITSTESKAKKHPQNRVISTDWVSIASNYSDGNKIDIPEHNQAYFINAASFQGEPRPPKIHVKAGTYEFEADENFPVDRLARILRELDVSSV